MKKTGLFKIIMIVLLIAVVASWFFSASYFDEGSLSEIGMNNVGLFDYFELMAKSFRFDYFFEIALLLLSIGAFYGVLEKTGKYRAWIEKIVKHFKGREFLFLVIVSFIITLISSIFSFEFTLLIFFPLLISILLAMGYDKVTVIAATFGAVLVGNIGSTVGYNTSGVIADLLNIKIADGFYFKLALLLISYVALLLFLSRAKRTKVTEKELEDTDRYIGEKEANKHSIVPIIVMFCIIFVFLILGCTNWESTFGVKVFSNMHDAIMGFSPKLPYIHLTTDGFEHGLKEIEIFTKIFGDAASFGKWFCTEMSIVLLFASLIISGFYKVRYFEAMKDGAKKMLKPALMVLFVYTVVYFAGNQMFYPTFAKAVLGLTSKFSVIISSILMAIASFFHVDILYVANYAVPQLAEKASDPVLVELLAQSIYGVVMFIAPTSALLVFGLEYLKLPYKEWVKKIWKLVLVLLAISLVVLLIAKYV